MKVPMRSINVSDRYFKISRDRIDDRLRASIREFGVLEQPVLMAVPGGYRVISGFNRLAVLIELDRHEVDASVVQEANAEHFVRQAILKGQRNELGPMGRLKGLDIMNDFFRIEPARLERIARVGLQVPGEYPGDGPLSAAVRGLPEPLKSYLDVKDIPFKVIRELARLPRVSIDRVTRWVSHAPLRANIFKGIVEMLGDIGERDGNDNAIGDIEIDENDDWKKWEELLFSEVYRARYPGYSALKKKADDIAGDLSRSGIRVSYPHYFEGDGISLIVDIRKRDDADAVVKKIAALDTAKLKELVDLL